MDEEIREAFKGIVWVSLGQEPDMRELQRSLHVTLTPTLILNLANGSGSAIAFTRDPVCVCLSLSVYVRARDHACV